MGESAKIITQEQPAQTTVWFILSLCCFAETKFIDKEALAAEEAYVQEIKESAKDLPIIDLGFYLPSPSPGLVVIYGSDGHINRFYNELEIANAANAADAGINAVITDHSYVVPYPGRRAQGTWTYGDRGNAITITSNSVLGEGSFSVYRDGVGGSGPNGSSGKTLGAGDVATKQAADNAKHNTALSARATDTDVLKTVYKNDIGYMDNTVIDVYFWGWNSYYFGYLYRDTLSFPGRYYYNY